MSLQPGTRLGAYEIVSPLGAGGMGEVYRARDTRLDRVVAIKVLPSHLAKDEMLRQRFEREARTVSSLNHPNICSLYDVGRQDGIDYLVMEFLDGETLAARLEKAPLPLDQVLRYAIQITDALDKAHRQGVMHRDLKPSNVMLTKIGAKLLDFGLAKSVRVAEAAAATITAQAATPLTAEGTIVGTFQYMAPEQLEGKEADARSDIFSLGAVIYEMATRRKAFDGKSRASVITAVMAGQPPAISTVQPMTPPALDRLVSTCLAKDPDERWQTAHDDKVQLQWIGDAGSLAGAPVAVTARRKSRERLAWALAALLGAASLLLAAAYVRLGPKPPPMLRAEINPPANSSFNMFALSPDARRLAYRARGSAMVFIRPLDSLTSQVLAGSENGRYLFWSPDSRSLGFFADGRLKTIDSAGGSAHSLCDAVNPRGASWGADGVIVFAPNTRGELQRASSSGGACGPATKLDSSRGEVSHRHPWFLPDGKHFLYLSQVASGAEGSVIYVGNTDDPSDRKLILRADSNPVYVPGYLIYRRERNMVAHPFDERRLELKGDAFTIADQLREFSEIGYFYASATGMVAYQTGATIAVQLQWFGADGKSVGPPIRDLPIVRRPELSRDGKRIAVELDDAQTATRDIWLHDMVRTVSSRFTFDPASEVSPVWSHDDSTIAFASDRKGNFDLYQKSSAGAGGEQVLLEAPGQQVPFDWSTDGRYLLYTSGDREAHDLWILPLEGGRKAFLLQRTEFNETLPRFSPDGKLVAYISNESKRYEVYVVSFDGAVPAQAGVGAAKAKWQVSTGGGREPRWRRDGKELLFISADNKMMAVDVKRAGGSVEFGAARPLFQTQAALPVGNYDVTADGRRFIMVTLSEESASPVILLTNWTAAIGSKR